MMMLQVCAIAAGVALVSITLRLLTVTGTLLAVLLAIVLFGAGGMQWLLPMIVFFIPSGLLSGITRKKKGNLVAEFEKPGARDAYQVIANGGIAGLIAVAFWFAGSEGSGYYLAYLGAVAASMADTWSTEIGLLVSPAPRLLTSGKRVAPGTSGAVSAGGLAGGLAGAACIALVSLWLDGHHGAVWAGIVTGAGMAGSLLDSLLGATVQSRNRCVQCGKLIEAGEHCNRKTEAAGGIRWLRNDGVNLCCSLTGALSAVALGYAAGLVRSTG